MPPGSSSAAHKRKTTIVYSKDSNKRAKRTTDGSPPSPDITFLQPSPNEEPKRIANQQSSPASAKISRNRTPSVTFSTPGYDLTSQCRQPDYRFVSSPTRSTIGDVVPLKWSSPTGASSTGTTWPSREAMPMDNRSVVPRLHAKPVQQFRPGLHPILEEAKRLMRDWTLFVNPLPEPKVLILQSWEVIQQSRETIGLKVLTLLSEDDREYLSSHAQEYSNSLYSPNQEQR
jgi:hypothetical protein